MLINYLYRIPNLSPPLQQRPSTTLEPHSQPIKEAHKRAFTSQLTAKLQKNECRTKRIYSFLFCTCESSRFAMRKSSKA